MLGGGPRRLSMDGVFLPSDGSDGPWNRVGIAYWLLLCVPVALDGSPIAVGRRPVRE